MALADCPRPECTGQINMVYGMLMCIHCGHEDRRTQPTPPERVYGEKQPFTGYANGQGRLFSMWSRV